MVDILVPAYPDSRTITDKITIQIGLTVNVNDLLRMLTGKKAIVYRLG